MILNGRVKQVLIRPIILKLLNSFYFALGSEFLDILDKNLNTANWLKTISKGEIAFKMI